MATAGGVWRVAGLDWGPGVVAPRLVGLQGLLVLLLLALPWLALPGRAEGATVRLTIYDDGLACPAGCDAHVVFHRTMNGTEFAHSPVTTTPPHANCTLGQLCRLCLASGANQCLEVVYRGGGPSPMTFDLTPRFYQAACAMPPVHPLLAKKCSALAKATAALVGRKNCIAQPSMNGCAALIEHARGVQATDRPQYDACKAIGDVAYNQKQPKERQRSAGCAYERYGTGGPNSKGTTWRRLLPGVCRDQTFVGRDGLDCCSGDTAVDGAFGLECRHFYPK